MKKLCRIPFESHVEYHEALADSRTVSQIKAHLAEQCQVCRRNLDWIASFVPTLRNALQNADQHVSQQALILARSIMRVEGATTVSRIVSAAHLLFDSRVINPAFATARDLGDGSVHVVYRVDAADIDLWQERSRSGSWYLTGEALSLTDLQLDAPIVASLTSDTHEPQIARLEDFEFSFDDLAAGRYSLRLVWDNMEIRVDDLAVGCAEGA